MKAFSMLSLTFGVALMLGTSCNNREGAHSTPLDSTNDLGTAPVQYQSGTPDRTTDSTMQTTPTDKRARQDSGNIRSMNDAQGGEKQPPARSNTTDAKSTSGSAK